MSKMTGSFQKGDRVRFKGGVDTFVVWDAPDDDIMLAWEKTGRLFAADYRLLEHVPTVEERETSVSARAKTYVELLECSLKPEEEMENIIRTVEREALERVYRILGDCNNPETAEFIQKSLSGDTRND